MRFKIFILISIFFSLFLFCPVQAKYGLDQAQEATGGDLPTSVGGANSLPELAGKIVNVALSLIGILFFCLMLYAGITWMKAFGSSEDVTKAKDMIQQAIIGLVIVMMAYAISNFVFSTLGATGGESAGGKDDECTKAGGVCKTVKDCALPATSTAGLCLSNKDANFQCCK